MTISCRDCDFIPKVPGAGEIYVQDNEYIQIMHDGTKIIKDCYYGAGTTEVIRQLKGHHEPQEETVFYHIIEKPRKDTNAPKILELGAFWSYYSLWAINRIPKAFAYLVEPDPQHLEVGQKNFLLNKCEGIFLQAGIGGVSLQDADFLCEDGITRKIPIENLPSLFTLFNLDNLDLLLLDIQGAETDLLKSSEELFKQKKSVLLLFLLIITLFLMILLLIKNV